MLRHLAVFVAAAVWSVAPALAQLPDLTSLTGVYNVRYLGVNTLPQNVAASFSGTLTFDGKGGFTVAGTGISADTGSTLRFRTSGTYNVLSSGMLIFDNPFDPTATNKTQLYGGLGGNGAVIASSTDTNYCDLFVAIPAATSASASTLNGAYRVAHMEFLTGDTVSGARNSLFTVNANGGSLGNVTVQGTAQSLRGVATTQTSTGATYTMTANGTGTLVLPAPSGTSAANTLISGSKILYVSADGSMFVAGSATGYDMEIGVRSSTTALNGLYWNSYLESYQAGTDGDGVYSGQGSANEIASASNLEIAHQRTSWEWYTPTSWDATFSDNFTFDNTGTAAYSDSIYALGADGTIAIGAGLGSNYLLTAYVKAPTMRAPAGTTVFLDPQGVVNAASSAPITTQVGPGELITLYGSGMGPATAVTAPLPFPTTLGGVRVLVSWSGNTAGTAIPVYVASAGQISAVVPYNAPSNGDRLVFQVEYNGVVSNKVEVFSGPSSPGMFSVPPGGPFPGAIQHADFSLVSSASPAKAGETVIMYMTGLGAVTGNVAAGTAAPTDPLATVAQPVFVAIGDASARVVFQGLTPGLAGLYQLNVTIPSGLAPGTYSVYIETSLDNGQTTDAYNVEGTIAIGN